MNKTQKITIKKQFLGQLNIFAASLNDYITDNDNNWTIKGFIDIFENIYTISSDTKIVSKVLEIHIFPKFLEFAKKYNYELVLADYQNYYPDISFISKDNSEIKFAVDLKTTYILEDYPNFCNGFTLGSHGKYFTDRKSTKNIQFPYGEYIGHYCLGIIYSRTVLDKLEETKVYPLSDLDKIKSVINNFTFFAFEKWRITSDKSGSGNTANIGSIQNIDDILKGNGVFKNLGEEIFDDYWINYGKIKIRDKKRGTKKVSTLIEYLKYRRIDINLANPKARRIKAK